MNRIVDDNFLGSEISFTSARSSGPGGQNVNKVNSKVILHFNVKNSMLLMEHEKIQIQEKLKNRITEEGILVISAQDKRSQMQNKASVIAKFNKLLADALRKKKSRKSTKPTKSSKEKRLTSKKHLADKKKSRQKPLL